MAKEKKVVPEDATLRRDVDAILRTEPGRRFWAHLARRLGFYQSSLRRRPDGEVAALSTECLEAQRLVYLELRQIPSRALLTPAEELAEAPTPLAAKSTPEERKP